MEIEIQNTKIDLINWITTLEDKTVISKIMALKAADDWWFKLNDSEKKSIEKGILDADAKRLNSNDKAKEIYEKWL